MVSGLIGKLANRETLHVTPVHRLRLNVGDFSHGRPVQQPLGQFIECCALAKGEHFDIAVVEICCTA